MPEELEPKKNCYILFSESRIGVHAPKKEGKEEYVVFAETFLPQYRQGIGWIYDGRLVIDAIMTAEAFEERGYDVRFLIGYDLDENGEFMANSLRKGLLAKDVPGNMIYRTPLTEKGYVSITHFLDMRKYEHFRLLDSIFQRRAFEKTGVRIGLLKTLALYMLQKNRGKIFPIKNSGNSTSTVIYKALNEQSKRGGI